MNKTTKMVVNYKSMTFKIICKEMIFKEKKTKIKSLMKEWAQNNHKTSKIMNLINKMAVESMIFELCWVSYSLKVWFTSFALNMITLAIDIRTQNLF